MNTKISVVTVARQFKLFNQAVGVRYKHTELFMK